MFNDLFKDGNMDNNYSPQQQKQDWEQECAEVAAMDFDRIQSDIDAIMAEDYDGSDEKTNQVLAEIIQFEDFLAGRTNEL